LARFVSSAYAAAAVDPTTIDSGAVILTGEAAKRRNAAAVSQLLADVAGDFVCATAGHRLEAIIAAHGSGAVAESRDRGKRVLNVDIGGGTTKLALIDDGIIVASAAISVGGRLVAVEDGYVTRVEPAGRWFAKRIGIDVELGSRLEEEAMGRLATSMAESVIGAVLGGAREIEAPLWLTQPLRLMAAPDAFAFSGGVARYVHGLEERPYGDLGRMLGRAVESAFRAAGLWSRVVPPHETIRATVIGASQYTVQVSGSTVFVPDPAILPIRNLKVVAGPPIPSGEVDTVAFESLLRQSLEYADVAAGEGRAVALNWGGRPYHARLASLAGAISAVGMGAALSGARRPPPLVLIFDKDVAQSVGRILVNECGWRAPLVCLDGISVSEFDFVDIGTRIEPSGAYPVVVKSLIFGTPFGE
jgi:ethanolamine utilization protein EutA